MPVTWFDVEPGKITFVKWFGSVRVKPWLTEPLSKPAIVPQIVDAEQVDETGAGRILYKGEIVRRMRRWRDRQRNGRQQTARGDAPQGPKKRIVRAASRTHVDLPIHRWSGRLSAPFGFTVRLKKIGFASPVRRARTSPESTRTYPRRTKIDLFCDFLATAT